MQGMATKTSKEGGVNMFPRLSAWAYITEILTLR